MSEVEHDEEFNEKFFGEMSFGQRLIRELEMETAASRKCLERISEDLFDWKPHEKSMNLGYLALLVAEIPKWITTIINEPELDFAKFEHFQPKTNKDLVKHFDENLENAKKALRNVADEELEKPFYLKSDGQVVSEATKRETLEPAINHLVHHRGQLTVFMRLKNIAVPSIYGPSADDKGF